MRASARGLESAAAAPERSTLERRVAGTRGLLLNLDGVLVLRNEPLPGTAEALTRLDAAGVPHVVATNTSLIGRAMFSRELSKAGLAIPAERIVSASSAAAAYCLRRFAGNRCTSWPLRTP